MLLQDILATKGSAVVSIPPDVAVLDAVRVLVKHNIGAVMVEEGDRVVGILSERDVLRLTADGPTRLAHTEVAEVMTRDLVMGVPGDDVTYAMTVMTNNRVRHLPVLDGGRLAGIVSIGDLVNASLANLQAENRWLRDYVQGGG
jgi:CBS domain-containing protein